MTAIARAAASYLLLQLIFDHILLFTQPVNVGCADGRRFRALTSLIAVAEPWLLELAVFAFGGVFALLKIIYNVRRAVINRCQPVLELARLPHDGLLLQDHLVLLLN